MWKSRDITLQGKEKLTIMKARELKNTYSLKKSNSVHRDVEEIKHAIQRMRIFICNNADSELNEINLLPEENSASMQKSGDITWYKINDES